MNYCSCCGGKLIGREIGDEGLADYCEACGKFFFDNPKCCVLICIFNEKKQVLLLRQNYISKVKWTLCSGYVQHGEDLESAARREVFEETGQEILRLQYVCSYYFAEKGLVMPAFAAFVRASEFGKSDEVDDLKWFDVNMTCGVIATENNFSGEFLECCLKFVDFEKLCGG